MCHLHGDLDSPCESVVLPAVPSFYSAGLPSTLVHLSSVFLSLFFKLSNFHCPVFEFMDFLLSAEICSGNILCLFMC